MDHKFLKVFAGLFGMLLMSQSPAVAQKRSYEVFGDKPLSGLTITPSEKAVREGGYSVSDKHKGMQYIYVDTKTSPTCITGLSVPIRENPGPGEYRYITFAWVKWGGDEIGIRFGASNDKSGNPGRKYDYTYVAGSGKHVSGLRIEDKASGHWTVITRDLWKDFGDFTLTDISLLCPTRRDAGFDAIALGSTPDAFANAPQLLPDQVAKAENVSDEGDTITLSEESNAGEETGGVQIDWAAQIKAGGVIMYPLYLLGVLALVISIQRFFTSNARHLAPKDLSKAIQKNLSSKNYEAIVKACEQYPSTLGKAVAFIVQHRHSAREVVGQTAGDMAARDIRTHLSRIYSLSVIASLSPLLGLFGTIVGMIEAFGLVALYGDEGGASILSDSISKALITTAAGLIVAMPSIAVYFVIRSRVLKFSSEIETCTENVINALYLDSEETSKKE